VRIALDREAQGLRAGMSATVEIDTKPEVAPRAASTQGQQHAAHP
jgi:hypothetical protein